MALISRADVPEPAELRREIVDVPALGGEVAVIELALIERLEFESMRVGPGAEKKDEGSKPGIKRRGDRLLVPQLLALSVVDADDEPIFDVKQWQAFGARNRNATVELFNAAFRLNGFDDAAEKKGS